MTTSMSGMVKYYSVCFLFYLIFVMWLPLVHSDWQWHSDYGVQMLQNHFVDVNGRYLSNLLEFYAVRYEVIRWLSYSAISLLLIIAIVQFVEVKHKSLYFMIAFGFMLIIPSSLFSHSYGWFEGFYNYVPATACMIYSLWYVSTIFGDFSRIMKRHHIIFYIVSFSGQLLLEQVTFYNILITVGALLIYGFKFKRLNPKLTMGCILTLLGAFIMYANTSHDRLNNVLKIPQNSNEYVDLALRSYEHLTITLNNGVFFNNVLILTVVGLVLIILLCQSTVFKNTNPAKKIMISSGLVIFQCYDIIIYQSFNFKQYEHFIILNSINFGFAVIFLVALVVAIRYLEVAPHIKLKLYMLSCSLVFMIVSLSFYEQIAYSYFYITYVIWVVILLILVSQLNLEKRVLKLL